MTRYAQSNSGILSASTTVLSSRSPESIGSVHTQVGVRFTGSLRDTVGGATLTAASLKSPGAPSGSWALTQVDDQGGSTRHMGQATTGLQPLLDFSSLVNGYPLIKHDGTDDVLDTLSAFTGLTAPYSLMIIGKIRSLLNNIYLVSGADSTHQCNIITVSPQKWAAGTTATFITDGTGDLLLHDIIAVYNGASSVLYVDGVATAGSITTQSPTKFRLGARYDALGPCPLSWAEFVAFGSKAISATEALQLHNWRRDFTG